MTLVLVTGISGSGKSAVRDRLRTLGLPAVDTDDDGISGWWENETGRFVRTPPRETWRSREWQLAHSWRMSRSRLERIARNAGSDTVFICGTAANEDEVWDLFSTVVCLYLDDDSELRKRLGQRATGFGSEPSEMEAILGWHRAAKSTYRNLGTVMVDAAQPLEAVVDDILAAVEHDEDDETAD